MMSSLYVLADIGWIHIVVAGWALFWHDMNRKPKWLGILSFLVALATSIATVLAWKYITLLMDRHAWPQDIGGWSVFVMGWGALVWFGITLELASNRANRNR